MYYELVLFARCQAELSPLLAVVRKSLDCCWMTGFVWIAMGPPFSPGK